MSRIYIELIAGVVVLIIGLAFGWHFGSLHWHDQYSALLAQDQAASAKVTADSAARAAKLRDDYDAALTAISNKYHQDLVTSDAAADGLTQQLHDYEDRLRAVSVSEAAHAATGTHAACPEPSRDPRLDAAIGRVVKTAGADAVELTGLQAERASIAH